MHKRENHCSWESNESGGYAECIYFLQLELRLHEKP